MYPADWIWQQYGLCLGWRCSQCKEKVLARSLPFKGLRKRRPDPDELRDRAEAASSAPEAKDSPPRAGMTGEAGGGEAPRNNGRRGAD